MTNLHTYKNQDTALVGGEREGGGGGGGKDEKRRESKLSNLRYARLSCMLLFAELASQAGAMSRVMVRRVRQAWRAACASLCALSRVMTDVRGTTHTHRHYEMEPCAPWLGPDATKVTYFA